MKGIIANPKHNVETKESIRRIEKPRVPSRNTISYLRKHSGVMVENPNGFIKGKDKNYIATMVVDKRKITTIDIYENRFVKYMITNIIKRLNVVAKNIVVNMISNKASNKGDNTDDKVELHKFLKNKISILNKHLTNGFSNVSNLTGKKTMSLVFQMAPGYREVYKKYIMLSKGLALGDGLYQMNQRPDTVLNIRNLNNKDDNRIYIFDAKYRINVDDKGLVGPVEDDINVMHRYRDAIVSKLSNDVQFKYDTLGPMLCFLMEMKRSLKNMTFTRA
ncbi:DUF2357 domain-containing protein [Clostridium estertheticum]|uniref:DUF2357 domain-containing protein n=1 Tax=Clostridium estertheticum TaxID=238834 RepID=UPI001C0E4377|nr:DUF2357 domain-containing protein [Clostridium estertheticum]MBU3171132.1 restriction endonuclease-like protein [Clostridium estertheticum]